MAEPSWAKGLREATSAFMAARGQTVQEDLAYRQDARAQNADQRAGALLESGLKSQELQREAMRQEIALKTEEERRRALEEKMALDERAALAAIHSGKLESLIGEVDDPETEARMSAMEAVLPRLSPKAQAMVIEEAQADFQRAGQRKSLERVRSELGRAVRKDQTGQPLMDEKTARAKFEAVQSYMQTGEGLSPDEVLQGIVQMRQQRAEKKYELSMTQRMFGKIATLLQQPGFHDAGVEKASKIMAMAMEFPPENQEQRQKLYSEAIGALLDIKQRTVKVQGAEFEDVNGWSKGGRIPNPRQLEEMRLVAASLLSRRRDGQYQGADEATRSALEDRLAKSIAKQYGWEAWPQTQGGYEGIGGQFEGMKTGQQPTAQEPDLASVAKVLASGADSKAVQEAMVKAGMDPYKITPEQKAKIRELAQQSLGKLAPGKSTGTGGK